MTTELIREIVEDTARTWDRNVLQMGLVLREITGFRMSFNYVDHCVNLFDEGWTQISLYWDGPWCVKALWFDANGALGSLEFEEVGA